MAWIERVSVVMKMTTLQQNSEDLIKGYHHDLLAFLKAHFEAASQDGSMPDKPAGFMMTKLRARLGLDIEQLERAGERRFGEAETPQRFKELVAKAAGWTVGLFSGLGEHGTSKTLRDEYVFLNAVSVGYSMLYTTEFGANGNTDYARMLWAQLRQWNDLIVSFNRSLPSVVLADLAAAESSFDKGRTMEITERLQATWKGEADGSGEPESVVRESALV